jgi:hypothetical protein
MPPEVWSRLHGEVRPWTSAVPPAPFEPEPFEPASFAPGPVPWWDPEADASFDPFANSITIGGVEMTRGTHVRLEPSHRADAQDVFLKGMSATVAGVFSDVDGSELVAVTVDDDPATAELAWQGRFLFFHPDEVVPLSSGGPSR